MNSTTNSAGSLYQYTPHTKKVTPDPDPSSHSSHSFRDERYKIFYTLLLSPRAFLTISHPALPQALNCTAIIANDAALFNLKYCFCHTVFNI